MCRQAIDSTLWEVLAALFARVRVTVAVVVELRPAHEVLKNQRVWFATHGVEYTTPVSWCLGFSAKQREGVTHSQWHCKRDWIARQGPREMMPSCEFCRL